MYLSLQGFISSFRLLDILDILLVAFVLYKLFILIRNTRAVALIKGLLVLGVVTVVSKILDLHVINWMLQQGMTVILVALPVVFQPELRRALEQIGRGRFFRSGQVISMEELERLIDEIVAISESLRIGSNTFDEAIVRYLEKIKHVAIGQHTAEELKILIGTAMGDGRRMTADVRGRSTETGLPVSVDIDSQEIRQALDEPIQTVLKTIVSILEKTPPELAADIADHGIVLTGGGLLLDSFDRLISQTTGMAAYLCDEPLLCVANGAGKALREMDRLKDSFDDL